MDFFMVKMTYYSWFYDVTILNLFMNIVTMCYEQKGKNKENLSMQ